MNSSVLSEIRDHLRRYLSREITLDDFRDWFDAETWDIIDKCPAATQQLAGEIELRIADAGAEGVARRRPAGASAGITQGRHRLQSGRNSAGRSYHPHLRHARLRTAVYAAGANLFRRRADASTGQSHHHRRPRQLF